MKTGTALGMVFCLILTTCVGFVVGGLVGPVAFRLLQDQLVPRHPDNPPYRWVGPMMSMIWVCALFGACCAAIFAIWNFRCRAASRLPQHLLTEAVAELARRVQVRLTDLYSQVGEPEPGSTLDQSGLRDGQSIVEDYISHGELGLAVEHVIYMVVEPGIRLSGEDHASLESVCRAFGISAHGLLPPASNGA